MLKKLLPGALLCLLCTATIAQDEVPTKDEEVPKPLFGDKKIRPAWMEKMRYGGNVSAQFFNPFLLDVAPMAGYKLTNSGKTIAGLSAVFTLYDTWKEGDKSYGIRPFIRQSIFKGVFAHVEYEMMNAEKTYFYNYKTPSVPEISTRRWGGTPYLGLGYNRGGMKERGFFFAILFNPLYPNNGYRSVYTIGGDSPFSMRAGFF